MKGIRYMQFNSYEFILIFLPLLLAGYYLLNRLGGRWGRLFLGGMGAVFYVYYGLSSAAVLLGSIVVNYAAAALIARREKHVRLIFALDIAANIALLLYFKYFNFLLGAIGSPRRFDIFLPLGISFFTFQQIAYVAHVRKTGKNESLGDYLLYVLYFPKLIMGPITEPDALIPQFHDESCLRPNAHNLACGLKLFSFGLFKKLLLADTFAVAVNWCFADPSAATSMELFLGMLAYTFEIYFDFSGYSDMAVGVSQMLNIDLPINFNSPYRALSVRDFWKRWHISLTSFLTRHLYIPLGGSRMGLARTCVNMMIVFLVSGIWHGANWTFLLWGLLHGLLCVGERVFEKSRRRLNDTAGWLFTFLCVSALWLLFRSDSVGQWSWMLLRMLKLESTAVSAGFLECFALQEAAVLVPLLHLTPIRGAMALLFYAAAFLLCLIPENNYRQKDRLSAANAVLAALALFLAFLHLGGESVFVYFNF